MMEKPIVEAPRPWVDEADVGGEAPFGRLFRAVAEPEPLSASALARVQQRLGAARYSSRAQRRLREFGLAFVMVLAGSSLALASWGASEWWSARRWERAAESEPPQALSAARKQSTRAPAVAVPRSLDTSATSAGAATRQPTAPKAAPATALDHPGSLAGTADLSALAAEAQALERVLVKLRREHDAAGALSLLNESQALFARGTLALEAQVARVDALLLLGRQGEALQILEQLPFAQVGRGAELRLVRAELRALSDCGRAVSDFDALVSQPLGPALLERALYGRAACELRLADDSQALRDFKQYLAHFPQGRFAARALRQRESLLGKARLGDKSQPDE